MATETITGLNGCSHVHYFFSSVSILHIDTDSSFEKLFLHSICLLNNTQLFRKLLFLLKSNCDTLCLLRCHSI